MDPSPVPSSDDTKNGRSSNAISSTTCSTSSCHLWLAKLGRRFTQRLPLDDQQQQQQQQSSATPGHKVGDTLASDSRKCMTLLDLVCLGMGSACGIGMYLTSGIIGGKLAGPSGIVSIAIGGIGSLLAGLHYAELAGLCPWTSGSSYFYTYVTIGELAAFLIGWSLMAEYIVTTAFAAVATSHTVNSVLGGALDEYVYEPMTDVGLPKIDFIAAIICISLTLLLALGVKMSAKFNNSLNLINMSVLVVFASVSVYLGSYANWKHSGFAPFGYQGVLAATPVAYCSFIGFDAVASTGGECKDPVKGIPLSIILANVFNTIIFSLVVALLTWDVPYQLIAANTAMLDVFPDLGVAWMKYVIAVGAVSGLLAATFGSMFPLPRILQSMSQDGLFFRYFSQVCPKRQTAFRATILTGSIAAVLAGVADLSVILELTLMSTLFVYIIVVMAALAARFIPLDSTSNSNTEETTISPAPLHQQHQHGASQLFETTSEGQIIKSSPDADADADETTLYQSIKPSSHTDQKKRKLTSNISSASSTDQKDEVMTAWQYTQTKDTYASVDAVKSNQPAAACHTKSDDTCVVHRASCPSEKLESGYDLDPALERQYILPKGYQGKHYLRGERCCSTYDAVIKLCQKYFMQCLCSLYISLFVLCLAMTQFHVLVIDHQWLTVIVLVISTCVIASVEAMLLLLPQIERRTSSAFRSPLIPYISVVTAAFNIFLMVRLTSLTWILFSGWMGLGIIIYLLYGTSRSVLTTTR